MKNEYKMKEILRKHLEEATDEISDLKDESSIGIWGKETVNCMVEASFAVFKSTMDAQDCSIEDGYTQLIE